MNIFYGTLDIRFGKFRVYNVHSMSDEFMVVSGMPQEIGLKSMLWIVLDQFFPGEEHVSEIAAMALDLLAGSVVFQIPHKPKKRIQIRMGFHRSQGIAILGNLVKIL